LLELIQRDAPGVEFNENATDEKTARQLKRPYTVYTGNGDINKIMTYGTWNGRKYIDDIWAYNMSVVGSNDDGIFPPFIVKDQRLTTFEPDYVRPLGLVQTGTEMTIKGIKLYEYVLANDTFSIDPKYYQSIEGFANMSSFYNSTPIFLGNPHMLGASQVWRDKVLGINGKPLEVNQTRDQTRIYVEPYTGKVMAGYRHLQVNFYLDNTTDYFSYWNTNCTTGLFYPVMWANDYGVISDYWADQFKNQVYFAEKLKVIAFWAAIGLGALCFILSVTMILLHTNSKPKGYDTVSTIQ